MEFLKLLMWFSVNVCVPFLAPIALLPLLGLRKRFKGRTREIVMRSLQEGQLCWTVIAMCVAACYEASGEVHSFAGYPTANIVIARLTTIWHGCMIVVASIVMMLGHHHRDFIYAYSFMGWLIKRVRKCRSESW